MGWPKTRETEYVSVPQPILIVCEDKKSAVFYLKAKIKSLRLHYADVVVDGDSGSAPISVVDYAIKKKGGKENQLVYCVMDVDDHTTLKTAIAKAKANGLRTIISNESFELWYLLHFIAYSTASLSRKQINKALSEKLAKSYDKGDKGIFEMIKAHEGNAWKVAALLYKHAKENSTQRDPLINPSTEVHLLLTHLHKVAKVPEPKVVIEKSLKSRRG